MKRVILWLFIGVYIVIRLFISYFFAREELFFLEKKNATIISTHGIIKSEILVRGTSIFFEVNKFTVVARLFGGFDNRSPLKKQKLAYGDEVFITGTFKIRDYGDPRKRGIIDNASITVTAVNKGNNFIAIAYRLKSFVTERLQHLFHEPASSLAGGILIGTRSDIPRSLLDDFKATGLMHVVAVSGFNMVIIIAAVTQALSFFYRRTASMIALLFILFFTILVGPTGAVVRAAVMASLRLIAWLIGRPQYVKRLFALTALLLIAIDPLGAVYDIGFQLSIMATGGLIWFSNGLVQRLKIVPTYFGLRENLASTIAATVATLPVTWFYFGQFSYLSIIVNLLVVPLVPWLMLGSFISLFFGMIGSYPTSILFDLMVFIIEKGASLERFLH